MKLSDFNDEGIIVGLFYGELRGTLETIRFRLFGGKVDYDEMVSEFYLFLAQDDWRRLRTFGARNGCSLKTWLSTVAWRFFYGSMRRFLNMSEGNRDYDLSYQPSRRIVSSIDIRTTLAVMPNRRYAEAVNLLIFRGYEAEEVAELWHTKVSNVYNIRHRAIDQFKKCYLDSTKRAG